jgi:trans-aconitate 2-methyltransferase
MWDPTKYLAYSDLRGRPFYELIASIGTDQPRRVVDLGCGPGNLTDVLRQRWPDAILEASDGSPEMVAAARAAGVDAQLLDVRDWKPAADTDVVVSNAVLQWVPEHRELLRKWASELPSGAWIAVQVPGNFNAPSHALARRLAASDEWSAKLEGVLLAGDSVGEPRDYADLLTDAGCTVDAWETTYLQKLHGEDAVLEWLGGTTLRPVRQALNPEEYQRFRAQLAPLLNEAYPPRPDGATWFPFRRIFVVAHTS